MNLIFIIIGQNVRWLIFIYFLTMFINISVPLDNSFCYAGWCSNESIYLCPSAQSPFHLSSYDLLKVLKGLGVLLLLVSLKRECVFYESHHYILTESHGHHLLNSNELQLSVQLYENLRTDQSNYVTWNYNKKLYSQMQ